ncbi:hypothetical protein BS50DRAFT_644425 [Corynespora cassiicola Philippines]|uniref:Uncharacterized protein n=1 Tax=Corynespora cassiicola Philippines TaxID=1448308 RepID=A0A2T2PCZ7_CORCC|nr:hypothetical protein BS50DRAFT_644425 [Corynespora cassiicola Philippines]
MEGVAGEMFAAFLHVPCHFTSTSRSIYPLFTAQCCAEIRYHRYNDNAVVPMSIAPHIRSEELDKMFSIGPSSSSSSNSSSSASASASASALAGSSHHSSDVSIYEEAERNRGKFEPPDRCTPPCQSQCIESRMVTCPECCWKRYCSVACRNKHLNDHMREDCAFLRPLMRALSSGKVFHHLRSLLKFRDGEGEARALEEGATFSLRTSWEKRPKSPTWTTPPFLYKNESIEAVRIPFDDGSIQTIHVDISREGVDDVNFIVCRRLESDIESVSENPVSQDIHYIKVSRTWLRDRDEWIGPFHSRSNLMLLKTWSIILHAGIRAQIHKFCKELQANGGMDQIEWIETLLPNNTVLRITFVTQNSPEVAARLLHYVEEPPTIFYQVIEKQREKGISGQYDHWNTEMVATCDTLEKADMHFDEKARGKRLIDDSNDHVLFAKGRYDRLTIEEMDPSELELRHSSLSLS